MINSRGYSYNNDGQKSNNDSSASYGNSYTTNDIIGIAMDLDNGKLYFSKNGTYQNSGVPTSGSTGTGSAYDISSGYTYAPCIATYTATDKLECNFGSGFFGTTAVASANTDANGHGAMEYTVPSGYYTLNTKNNKGVWIMAYITFQPHDYFNTKLYTGNGSTNNITGVGFQPDWVWIKGRSYVDGHKSYDAVRGVSRDLTNNDTAAEGTTANGLTAFDSDGFTLGDWSNVNRNSETHVAWELES